MLHLKFLYTREWPSVASEHPTGDWNPPDNILQRGVKIQQMYALGVVGITLCNFAARRATR